MDYATEKTAVLAEADFLKLGDRLIRYADMAAAAARQDDLAVMNAFIRLAYWVLYREADFVISPIDIPMFDEHTHALVGDTPVEAFAAAIEVEPPPESFNETLTLARASRGN